MKKGFTFDGNGVVGTIIGLAGLAFAGWQTKKAIDLGKKLDMSISDLEKKTVVEISQAVVDRATTNAVEREVKMAASEAVAHVRSDIQSEVTSRVRTEVNGSLETIASQVSDEISTQVAAIDEYALQKKVQDQAEAKILKKFDGALDGVLGDFRHQLGNVRKVWESVADAMGPRNSISDGRSMTFKLD